MQDYLTAKSMAVMIDALDSELSNVDITPKIEKYSNEQIFELFNKIKAPKLSPKTVLYYLDSINRLIAYAGKTIANITSIDIESFLGSLAANNSAVSLNNHRRNISAFYRWLCKQAVIDHNPCDAVEPYKEIDKPIDHMEAPEYEQLKSGCDNTKSRAIIEFLRSTAVRVGEMILIKYSDVNLNDGTVRIYAPKTQSYRTVYLDAIALKYLKEYIASRGTELRPDMPLFTLKRKDNAISPSAVRSELKKIKNKSHLTRRVYPHLFRKTTATNIIKRGGSIHDAGEYLGHKDQSVTGKHYGFIDEEHTKYIFMKYVAAV